MWIRTANRCLFNNVIVYILAWKDLIVYSRCMELLLYEPSSFFCFCQNFPSEALPATLSSLNQNCEEVLGTLTLYSGSDVQVSVWLCLGYSVMKLKRVWSYLNMEPHAHCDMLLHNQDESFSEYEWKIVCCQQAQHFVPAPSEGGWRGWVKDSIKTAKGKKKAAEWIISQSFE